MCLQYNYNKAHIVAVYPHFRLKVGHSTCPYFSLLAVSGTLHFVYYIYAEGYPHVPGFIRNELNEAAGNAG
ncbi:hypothetical protein ACLK2I_01280 [Escherichia coli]